MIKCFKCKERASNLFIDAGRLIFLCTVCSKPLREKKKSIQIELINKEDSYARILQGEGGIRVR